MIGNRSITRPHSQNTITRQKNHCWDAINWWLNINFEEPSTNFRLNSHFRPEVYFFSDRRGLAVFKIWYFLYCPVEAMTRHQYRLEYLQPINQRNEI